MWSLDLFVLLLHKPKLFISSIYHTRENIQFLASRYCRIGTFHCVLCLIVGCGVMQVVLKKIAIVIRRTSKGNKVKIAYNQNHNEVPWFKETPCDAYTNTKSSCAIVLDMHEKLCSSPDSKNLVLSNELIKVELPP